MSKPKIPASRSLAVVALVVATLLAGCATTGKPRSTSQKHLGVKVSTPQWVTLAERAERGGDDEQALVLYVSAASSDPKNAELHYRIGRIQAAKGNVAPAGEAFRRALALAPGHAGALEGMGLLMLHAGKNDAARKMLESALAKEPARWRTLNGLGVLADLRGDSPKALAYFRSALILQPNRVELLNNMGYSYYLADQVGPAQNYFERVTSLAPDNRLAWSNLGLVYARKAQYPQAVRALERVMTPAEARYATAYYCMLSARMDDAATLLEEAIRLSPTYYEAAELALRQVNDRQPGAGARKS